jgi:hypothetical protein
MFLETDVNVTDEQTLMSWVSSHVFDQRRNGKLVATTKSMVIPTNYQLESFSSFDEASRNAKFLISQAKLVQHIVTNLRKGVVDAANGGSKFAVFKTAGIQFSLNIENIDKEYAWVDKDSLVSRFGSWLKPDTNYDYRYRIVDSYKPSFDGELAKAYALARERAFALQQFNGAGYSLNTTVSIQSTNPVHLMLNLAETNKVMTGHIKLDLASVREARIELLREKTRESDSERMASLRQSQANFQTYWGSLKSDIKQRVSHTEAHNAWATIPIPVAGTNTSRTWGIEVETVRADLVNRPAGWESVYDGSLESMSGDDCDCDCSDCYDGYHENCESGDNDSCREFVSPVLSHFNSNGLRDLCEPLQNVSHNSTPGIHVHVGADDLTIPDVARLIRAYSLVSPFIEPISHRESRGYCQDVSSSNVSHWLSSVRKVMRGQLTSYHDESTKLTPADIVQVSHTQPDDRYRDLNLTALSKHGTIEFRVMGAYYHYDHLVRWAWFCREMVNVARLDLPMSVWSSVRSMADVVSVLRQYGSELPSDEPDKKVVKLANVLNDTAEYVDA